MKPCPECGIAVWNKELHKCNPERAAKHAAKKLDKELEQWLESPEGQFEQFYAERRRREGSP